MKKKFNLFKLKVKEKSPEICIGVGIVTFAGTIALTIRQAMKTNDILEVHHAKITEIEEEAALDGETVVDKDGKEIMYGYPEELQRHDIRAVRLGTSIEMVKTWAPVAGLASISLTCFLAGFNILSKRYAAVVIAYNGVSEAFAAYRNRVIEEKGKIYDRHYMYGTELKEETRTVIDPETGKKKKETVVSEVIDSDTFNDCYTSRLFDKNNPNWYSDPLLSRSFLTAQLATANRLLDAKGYIFLNEVYDLLGFEPIPEGQFIGWVVGSEEGDGHVDFGLYDFSRPGVEDFVSGDADSVILEFNYDGVIYDVLKRNSKSKE